MKIKSLACCGIVVAEATLDLKEGSVAELINGPSIEKAGQ